MFILLLHTPHILHDTLYHMMLPWGDICWKRFWGESNNDVLFLFNWHQHLMNHLLLCVCRTNSENIFCESLWILNKNEQCMVVLWKIFLGDAWLWSQTVTKFTFKNLKACLKKGPWIKSGFRTFIYSVLLFVALCPKIKNVKKINIKS